MVLQQRTSEISDNSITSLTIIRRMTIRALGLPVKKISIKVAMDGLLFKIFMRETTTTKPVSVTWRIVSSNSDIPAYLPTMCLRLLPGSMTFIPSYLVSTLFIRTSTSSANFATTSKCLPIWPMYGIYNSGGMKLIKRLITIVPMEHPSCFLIFQRC